MNRLHFCGTPRIWTLCRRFSQIPEYNYGLPGKGKSKRSYKDTDLPMINGEIIFGVHSTYLALNARRRDPMYCIYCDSRFGNTTIPPHVRQVLELAEHRGVRLEQVSRNVLDVLTGNRPHQGVCLDAGSLRISEWNQKDSWKRHGLDFPIWLYLHNIQDPMNLGAVLRTAYFLGVDKVLVPAVNSCKLSPVVSKASAGAMEVMEMLRLSKGDSPLDLCKWWKSSGGEVVGTGVVREGEDVDLLRLREFHITRATLLILGNEGDGMGQELSHQCDRILTIQDEHHHPASLQVGSLNVSVAAGIVLHWLKSSSVKPR